MNSCRAAEAGMALWDRATDMTWEAAMPAEETGAAGFAWPIYCVIYAAARGAVFNKRIIE